MSERFGASERTIVEILRAGAENAAAPLAARERVRAKLSARAGMLGLVASATVTAGSAGAAAGSAATTTGSTAVGALALSKLLVVGMVFGASTGLGLHFVGQRPMASVGASVAAGASPPTVIAEPGPLPAPVPNGASVTTAGSEAKAGVPRAHAPLRAPEPTLVPTPELPFRPAPALDETLAAQQTLLDDARVALRRGEGEQAVRALEAHRARFPRTAFEEERRVVEIRALLLLGKLVAARESARAFVESYPKSMLLPSMKGELEKAGLSDFGTDSTLTPQSLGGGKEMP